MKSITSWRSFATLWQTSKLARVSHETRSTSSRLFVNVRNMSDDSGDGSEDCVAPKKEVVRFIADCLTSVGASCEDAQVVARNLMIADYRGHFSHGLSRLHMYLRDVEKKLIDPCGKPEIATDSEAVALVDGKNGFGQVIGKFCMLLAMEKARKYGIGMVSARGSNHYGMAAFYTLMAIDQDMIGFTCSNTSPLMAPSRSKKAGLGTNPLSLGMGTGCDQFLLDMATTAAALGKIEQAVLKDEPIPEGWALDSEGKMTTDAKKACEAATLLPLGGAEETSGYKGYGLSMMVEVLCGVLAGGDFGTDIRKWSNHDKPANLSQFFLAINPEAFTASAKDRLTKLIEMMRTLPPICESRTVVIPGDPEKEAMKKVDKEGGIEYHSRQIKHATKIAEDLNVEPMKLEPKKTC